MPRRHPWGIVLATGGTGGHVYPAIAVAEALARVAPGVPLRILATDDQRERGLFPEKWRSIVSRLPLPKPGTTLRSRTRMLRLCPLAFRTAHRALASFARRGVVLGFGGYASVPTVLAARSLGWEIILFEANAVLGRATRALLPFASCVLLGFPGASFQLGSGVHHLVTGVPVRQVILDAASVRQRMSWAGECETVVLGVLGGSQGAMSLNDAAVALPEMLRPERVWLVHQTGSTDWQRVRRLVGPEPSCVAAPFFENVGHLYQHTHLLIMRAGASCVAEAAVCGIPAVLVPYPVAADNHQTANATEAAKELGWAVLHERPAGRIDLHQLADAVKQGLRTKINCGDAFRELHATAAQTVATRLIRNAA